MVRHEEPDAFVAAAAPLAACGGYAASISTAKIEERHFGVFDDGGA